MEEAGPSNTDAEMLVAEPEKVTRGRKRTKLQVWLRLFWVPRSIVCILHPHNETSRSPHLMPRRLSQTVETPLGVHRHLQRELSRARMAVTCSRRMISYT